MRSALKVSLLFVLALTFVRAGCVKTRPTIDTSIEALRIKDTVYYHNVSIAYDGKHYFTINGGNEGYCTINEYSTDGKFIETYDVGLDGRAIFHNPMDGNLYIKDYGVNLYKFDPKGEAVEIALPEVFLDENSSPGMSPSGKYFYEFLEGEVYVYDSKTGLEDRVIEIDEYYDEHGYNVSTAASNRHLFVWGDAYDVLVYDLTGKKVSTFRLPMRGFGYSLSYSNGMLWIADDADAMDEVGEGYWFGYRVRD